MSGATHPSSSSASVDAVGAPRLADVALGRVREGLAGFAERSAERQRALQQHIAERDAEWRRYFDGREQQWRDYTTTRERELETTRATLATLASEDRAMHTEAAKLRQTASGLRLRAVVSALLWCVGTVSAGFFILHLGRRGAA